MGHEDLSVVGAVVVTTPIPEVLTYLLSPRRPQRPWPLQLICSEVCQAGRVRRRRGATPAASRASSASLGGERVVSRRAVRLIYAGWIPQDGVSAGSSPRV